MFKTLALVALLGVVGVFAQHGEVAQLTPKNFNEIVMHSPKAAFVKFYAPWCGHCVKLAPAWVELAKAFASTPNVVIAELDGEKYSDFIYEHAVLGFPTVRLYTKTHENGIIISEYEGQREETAARDVSAFTAFLKQHGVHAP